MASSYLIQMEDDYRNQARQEKYDVSSYVQSQIYSLQNSYQQLHKAKDSNDAGYLGAAGMAVVGALTGGAALLVGGALAAGATFLAGENKKDKINSHNAQIDQQIAALQAQEATELRKIDAKYEALIEQETERFKASVKASRLKYGGRTTAQPIVKWLSGQFEEMIQKADRRSHVKEIQVLFAFRTEQYMVATQKQVYGGSYGNAEVFDFNVNRFQPLPDFEDRIGFSQAIAKLVQFDIMNRFPKDPVAPSHAKPLVVITSNDTLMELRYQVANPNYRPAVTL